MSYYSLVISFYNNLYLLLALVNIDVVFVYSVMFINIEVVFINIEVIFMNELVFL